MVSGTAADGHTPPSARRVILPVRPAWLGLIWVGGTLGTGLRAWLENDFGPPPGQWPWVTLWINIGGSLILGVVLEALAKTGSDRGWRRGARLGVGTGLLGGFTTYGTFSVEVVHLFRSGDWLAAMGYALVSVAGGVLAAVGAMCGVSRLFRWWRGRGSR